MNSPAETLGTSKKRLSLALNFIMALASCGAVAQPVSSTLRIVVGTEAGGSYDLTGRLLARHLGHYLPGNPTIVVQNMPGAGGLVSANYLYNLAPRDGSTIGIVIPQVVLSQVFDDPNARFNSAKFYWIGNPFGSAVVSAVFQNSAVKDWASARVKTALMGATGTLGPDALAIKLANRTLGTKFRIVYGYKGGSDMSIAMERGEINGRGSQTWAGWKATNPDWVATKKIIPLWQLALKRDADLSDVPLLLDLVSGDENKLFVRIYSAISSLGRPIVAPPDVPHDVVQQLRDAFDKVMLDEAFRQDARKIGIPLGGQSGVEIQESMNGFLSIEPASKAKLKMLLSTH